MIETLRFISLIIFIGNLCLMMLVAHETPKYVVFQMLAGLAVSLWLLVGLTVYRVF